MFLSFITQKQNQGLQVDAVHSRFNVRRNNYYTIIIIIIIVYFARTKAQQNGDHRPINSL